MNPYVDIGNNSLCGDNGGNENSISYASIATRLLQDNYLLTALELHTELVESGRELPQLREFFSNPGNFEQHVSRADPSMHRTPSQATLDSLDLARYSEDGGGPGGAGGAGGGGSDVAVLEFELRKAKETINSLRANLTQFVDCDSSDKTKGKINETSLRPHEKRALNFLVNEYLLLQSYNLTAITFSDENPDQDFEDWDDVGLNVPRPCGLISLYRGDAAPQTRTTTVDVECQTDLMGETLCVSCQMSFNEDTDLNHEMLIQAEEILLLKQQVHALETDKVNYQKLYDAALASLNSLTTPVSDSPGLDLHIPPDRLAAAKNSSLERICEQPLSYAENHYGSNTSTNSLTPEQFEIIDCDKNVTSRDDSHGSQSGRSGQSRARGRGSRRGSAATLDDALSFNEAGDWTRVHAGGGGGAPADSWIDSSLPTELKQSILQWCELSTTDGTGSDLLDELITANKPISCQSLLPLVAETLLRIVPHTLVSRRCDAAALLAAAAHLLSSPAAPSAPAAPAAPAAPHRARLLQLLLTLLKKPDPTETRIICDAVCYIVKHGGAGEVLSCIAELLTSRSTERRIVSAHITLSISPYVPLELCTSLLLSLVSLMCDSSEPELRSVGLKVAVVVCAVGEQKYSQVEGITFGLLRDSSEAVATDCVRVLLPVLARSALLAGKFSSDLCQRTMLNLAKHSKESDWKYISLYLEVMKVLAVPMLAHVINVQIIKENATDSCEETIKSIEDDNELSLSLQCYLCNCDLEASVLVECMKRLVGRPGVTWSELQWFLEDIIKQLLNISYASKLLNHSPTYQAFMDVLDTLCKLFGQELTTTHVEPIFREATTAIEKKLETLQPVSPGNLACVGLCLAAVLPTCVNGEEVIESYLKKWLVCGGVCSLPAALLAEPLRWLAPRQPRVLRLALQSVTQLISSSSEREGNTSVRLFLATLLTELASSAELDEAGVESLVLPAVTCLVHDTDIQVRERGLLALGAASRLCITRAWPAAAHCWAELEAAAGEGAGAARGEAAGVVRGEGEVARAADALAMLLAPQVEATPELALKVLSLLCALCRGAPLTGAVLGALVPALQLAAHLAAPGPAFTHTTLLPALRCLNRIDSPTLQQHKQAVEVLMSSVAPAPAAAHAAPAPAAAPPRSTNILGSEAVGRRVTQMFHNSKTNMNIPNIFKKKS